MTRRPNVSTRVEVTGVSTILANMERISSELERDLQRIIKKYALRIERDAKRMAPVDEGRLRSSIRAVLEKLAAEVLTDVYYAPFQEFGTGRRGAASDVDPPENYVYGSTAGIDPNPFLVPAFERHRASFEREVRLTLSRRL